MIEIHKLTAHTAPLLNTVENRFLASEAVVVRLQRDGYALDYKPAVPTVWRSYPDCEGEDFKAEAMLSMADRDAYLAYLDGQHVGQMMLGTHTNRMAVLFDIRVAANARRRGVGEAMMELAEQWARQKGLGGLMAETQDSNPGACQFFTKCGLRLGGVDRLRYAAMPQGAAQPSGLYDCALFFYQLLQ